MNDTHGNDSDRLCLAIECLQVGMRCLERAWSEAANECGEWGGGGRKGKSEANFFILRAARK